MNTYPLRIIKAVAIKLENQLSEFCEKISIGGSIRRNKETVKDIELILLPKLEPNPEKLFDEQTRNLPLIRFLENWKSHNSKRQKPIKGKSTGKYMRLYYGIYPVDLFFAEPSNWGYILALRTGSSEFNFKILDAAKKANIELSRGKVYSSKLQSIEVKTEKDFFDVIQLPFIEPENR